MGTKAVDGDVSSGGWVRKQGWVLLRDARTHGVEQGGSKKQRHKSMGWQGRGCRVQCWVSSGSEERAAVIQ